MSQLKALGLKLKKNVQKIYVKVIQHVKEVNVNNLNINHTISTKTLSLMTVLRNL